MLVMYMLSLRNLFKISNLNSWTKRITTPALGCTSVAKFSLLLPSFVTRRQVCATTSLRLFPSPKDALWQTPTRQTWKTNVKEVACVRSWIFLLFCCSSSKAFSGWISAPLFLLLLWRDVEKPACSDGKLSGFFCSGSKNIFKFITHSHQRMSGRASFIPRVKRTWWESLSGGKTCVCVTVKGFACLLAKIILASCCPSGSVCAFYFIHICCTHNWSCDSEFSHSLTIIEITLTSSIFLAWLIAFALICVDVFFTWNKHITFWTLQYNGIVFKFVFI